jgi:hypothetical protein
MPRDLGLAVAESVANSGAAAALPDDRTMKGAAAAPIPHDEGLALVGDADAGDRAGRDFGRGDRFFGKRKDRAEDFLGVMLDPSGLRIELMNFGVSAAADTPARIDNEDSGAGSSLVDGKY